MGFPSITRQLTSSLTSVVRVVACAVALLSLSACATTKTPAPRGDELGRWLYQNGHAPASVHATALALAAMNYLDVPYTWGGNTAEEGFDCSGFTRHVYQRAAGINLPRTTEAQANSQTLTPVGRDDLAPGDLVFFNTLGRTYSHVGVYVGDNKFVHAPRTGAHVRVDNLGGAYWAGRFTGARRAA
jgi:cell wall-associated NlpC family hydrolase